MKLMGLSSFKTHCSSPESFCVSFQRVHSHLRAKVFKQELVPETSPIDEPQGRLGDSERWMSWEPKAPAAVPDNIGDSSEDDDEDEDEVEDESIEDDGEDDEEDKSSDVAEEEKKESEEDSQGK